MKRVHPGRMGRLTVVLAVFLGLSATALSHGFNSGRAFASGGIAPLTPQGAVLFQEGFDNQTPGALVTGLDRRHFDANYPNYGAGTVVATTAASSPNALQIDTAGPIAFNSEILVHPHTGVALPDLTLQFAVFLGPNFAQAETGYTVIGSIQPVDPNSQCGTANLVMAGAGNSLHVDYFPDNGQYKSTLYTDSSIGSNAWHVIDLTESTATGSIAVAVDGHVAGSVTGVTMTGCTIGGLAIGDIDDNSAQSGHLYFDDVLGISHAAFVQGSDWNGGVEATSFEGITETGKPVSTGSNGFSVNISGGGRAYAHKQYPVSLASHTLSFTVGFGSGTSMGASDYLVLAQTAPAYPVDQDAGKVDLVIAGPNNTVQLLYWDSSGNEHSYYTGRPLDSHTTHQISLSERVSPGSGSFTLTVDGQVLVNSSGLDTGTLPVGYFGLGLVYGTPNSDITGSLIFSDISTTTTDLAQPLPAAPSPTPTPTTTPTSPGWSTPTPTPSPTSPPPSGQKVIFSKTFNGDKPGPLFTANDPHDFGTIVGGSYLRVDASKYAYSLPNMLIAHVVAGTSAFGFKHYSRGYHTHTLTFALTLQTGWKLQSGDYVTLAATQYDHGNHIAGTIELNLASDRTLEVVVWDASDSASYHSTGARIPVGIWKKISLTEVTGSSGSLTISVDGKRVASIPGLDLPSAGVSSFAIGNIFSPSHYASPGNLFYDNIVTKGK